MIDGNHWKAGGDSGGKKILRVIGSKVTEGGHSKISIVCCRYCKRRSEEGVETFGGLTFGHKFKGRREKYLPIDSWTRRKGTGGRKKRQGGEGKK